MQNTTDVGSRQRIAEAIDTLRHKDVRSTTYERLRLTWEADALVQGLPQPKQLGEGLAFLLDRISLPVRAHDLLVGRISEQLLDEDQERFLRARVREWEGRSIPPWMRDGGHECLDWEQLLREGLAGLEERAVHSAAAPPGSARLSRHSLLARVRAVGHCRYRKPEQGSSQACVSSPSRGERHRGSS